MSLILKLFNQTYLSNNDANENSSQVWMHNLRGDGWIHIVGRKKTFSRRFISLCPSIYTFLNGLQFNWLFFTFIRALICLGHYHRNWPLMTITRELKTKCIPKHVGQSTPARAVSENLIMRQVYFRKKIKLIAKRARKSIQRLMEKY